MDILKIIVSFVLTICIAVLLCACGRKEKKADTPLDLPEGAQAVSLLGNILYAPIPSESMLTQYEKAKKDYQSEPNNPDTIIWYGRRTAYLGKYREAIQIYTEGIQKFSQDARMYRHRGHRYISIRELDRSIKDFEHAVRLIRGTKDEIEPDGLPNPQNIPVSTLHGNIWYHLGLAYYLQNNLEKALRAYRECVNVSKNDDMLVATIHWLYMTLRRLGREEKAKNALEPIQAEMDIIENMAYHQLCLFYKGEIPIESLMSPQFSSIMNDAVSYGIGNWFFYNGHRGKARQIFQKLLEQKGWASFGYIAAEADLVREFKE